jgi:hypothetical protein
MNETPSIPLIPSHKVNAGMPILEIETARSVSPYEFLPSWFFYTPVVMQSLVQGIYYRDLRLPLVANPSIKLSGMVGESKDDILKLAGATAQPWISPFVTLSRTNNSVDNQLQQALAEIEKAGLDFPIVGKPDLGCRGVGVKLLRNQAQLHHYIEEFPLSARFLLQQKAPYHAEAGVFYVRHPGEPVGKIISITLKYAPSVVGDGVHTLKQLIERCPRAGQLTHLYFPRHQEQLNWIPDHDHEFQLAFAGSHSRGSIFRNGNQYITPKLTEKLDQILQDVPGYHYGRLDIKFDNLNDFMNGEKFTILEINGASSEAAHIWDRNTPLKSIFSTLLMQYRLLYSIGAKQKKRGIVPPSLSELVNAWRDEKRLTKQYPATD